MLTLWLADKILSDLEGEEDLKLAMNMRKTIDILLFDLLYEILNAKTHKRSRLNSRKMSLMTLFGNGYDYKKRLLFTATHIE